MTTPPRAPAGIPIQPPPSWLCLARGVTRRAGTLSLAFLLSLLAAAIAMGPRARAQSVGTSGLDRSTAQVDHGVDLAGMDRSVRPGDDFFRFANGKWADTTPIPPDRSTWGIDAELAEQATERTRALLEDAAKGAGSVDADERKAADYYIAYMNEGAIERRGLSPLDEQLARVNGISDLRTLSEALGQTIRTDVDPLNATNFYTSHVFGLWVAQDFNDPAHNAPYLLQGGLGMPDREYYLADIPRMAETRAKYKAHVAAVLELGGAGQQDASAEADRIVDLETRIAKVHWSREDSGNVHKADNPWTRADFAAKAPGIDWAAFFKAAGLAGQSAFIVWQPSAVTGESALVRSEPIETWKRYLRYEVLNRWSNLLPKPFVQERFDFYGKVLSGTPQLPERWKRAVASTNAAMGDAVGRMYVQRYFPPEAKAKAQAMVADIKAAFGRRIDRLDWMSAETKTKAREKLATLIVGVGDPDKWRDYSSLDVSRDDALGNAFRAELYEYRRDLSKLHEPVDRNEWWMTPQTVNAVNLPVQNALNFPAAILQPPFFDQQASVAKNYGAIGAVIGHEISHSFDDQGSQFDASGRLANWWKPEDFAHFKEASGRLVAQYNAYRPVADLPVNGQQTLSENIADVAGLSAAYDAYRQSPSADPAAIRQGLTGDQQFFISFAQSWREKYREPLLRQLLLTDGHSPSEYRADTVRNLDPWYQAFGVQSGETLYLAPAARVRVW
jgi:putative endopeptidase